MDVSRLLYTYTNINILLLHNAAPSSSAAGAALRAPPFVVSEIGRAPPFSQPALHYESVLANATTRLLGRRAGGWVGLPSEKQRELG